MNKFSFWETFFSFCAEKLSFLKIFVKKFVFFLV